MPSFSWRRRMVSWLLLLAVAGGLLVLDIWSIANRSCEAPVIAIEKKTDTNREEAARSLFSRRLDFYEHKNGCLRSWLSAYTINDIEVTSFPGEQENEFIVIVSYSVKPFMTYFGGRSYWAENGGDQAGKWIRNKPAAVIIEEVGRWYKIKEIRP